MFPGFRQFIFALTAIASVIAFGILGYVLIEGWSAFDAFYMTVITITTVGYEHVHPLSAAGRIFTAVLILVGFGVVAYLMTGVAEFVLDGDLRKLMWKRKMNQMIDGLKQHYIICGYGRVGQIVAMELRERGIPFVATENAPDRIEAAKEDGVILVCGDALHDDVLLEAGITRAAGLITVLTRDSDNLLVSLSARELNHNIQIIARGEAHEVEPKLLRAGADIVVSPFRISGRHIADLLHKQNGGVPAQHAEATGSTVGGYALQAVHIREGDPATLGELLAQHRGAKAIAINRHSADAIQNPAPDIPLQPLDQVVLLVTTGTTGATESAESSALATLPVSQTVLVADDHDALRNVFIKRIRNLGYQVLAARDGKEAWEIIEKDKPCLAVLDVMMPHLSGYDVCRNIRSSSKLAATKVILFSNEDPNRLKAEGDAVGADAVLPKSAKGDELAALIRKLLD